MANYYSRIYELLAVAGIKRARHARPAKIKCTPGSEAEGLMAPSTVGNLSARVGRVNKALLMGRRIFMFSRP